MRLIPFALTWIREKSAWIDDVNIYMWTTKICKLLRSVFPRDIVRHLQLCFSSPMRRKLSSSHLTISKSLGCIYNYVFFFRSKYAYFPVNSFFSQLLRFYGFQFVLPCVCQLSCQLPMLVSVNFSEFRFSRISLGAHYMRFVHLYKQSQL